MNRLPPPVFWLLAGVFLLTGCEQLFQNATERNLAEAEKRCAGGDYAAAVELYEGGMDGTLKTAEMHYKLGLIYDINLNQPVSAIHHYQRYLELAPKGPHAKEAKGFLQEDRLKLATDMGKGATLSLGDAARLKNENLELRKKNAELRTKLEEASKARAAMLKAMGGKGGSAFRQEQIQKPLVEGVRTHTVAPGDTLASIARKYYSNPGRWRDIQDANFEPMEETARLKIGMVLMIP